MAIFESLQKKITRVRKPRVHITYDLEIGNAIEMKEIPFVVGVLGDFSFDNNESLPELRDRRFAEVDRDNFNAYVAKQAPRLRYKVENKLTNEGGKLAVDLSFNSLADFNPDNIVQNYEPLRQLMELRNDLQAMRNKIDANRKLDAQIKTILESPEKQQILGRQLGVQALTDFDPNSKPVQEAEKNN